MNSVNSEKIRMTSAEVRERFLTFFEKRGHARIHSASLVPGNDPTVLFNTAGMQPLVPYLMGAKHPKGDKLVNVQKCVRTTDIDDIGDSTHATFFEMLGNWSLGSYFKEDAIWWSYEFLTSKKEGLGLDPARLYVTVFAGDSNAPRDLESAKIWERVGVPAHRIYFKGVDSNWWPAVKGGDNWTGPTGPSSEMFYDITPDGLGDLTHQEFLAAEDEQKLVEIWNDVFMEFEKQDGKVVRKLKQKNVDTGAGLERLLMVMQRVDNIYDTDLFLSVMEKIPALEDQRLRRIVADHIRTAVFLMADGVVPSNTDRGYVLRRILRRAVRYADILRMKNGALSGLAEVLIEKYGTVYPNLKMGTEKITNEIITEEQKFRSTLTAGLKEFEKILRTGPKISGVDAFNLFSTFGFPFEMTVELAGERGGSVDEIGFKEELGKHRTLSRAGAEKKFKGGLADTSEMSLKYHTATHLLNAALRKVLGEHVLQKGSNITPERLRFDFTHDAKMTEAQKKQVEDLVNQKIKEALPVSYEEMPLEKAREIGAMGVFGEKYADVVKVYTIGDPKDARGAPGAAVFSREICGGPHVENTKELGRFKISKEEVVSAGVRRIKALLE